MNGLERSVEATLQKLERALRPRMRELQDLRDLGDCPVSVTIAEAKTIPEVGRAAAMHFKSETWIQAPPDKVWDVLVDLASWPQWDPFCEKIEGRIGLGQSLRAFSTLSPGRAFPVRVETFSPPQRMVWVGGMPLGLFRGERRFTLEEENGGTRFCLEEHFSGPLLFLIGRTIPDLNEAFEAFTQGLKQRVERTSLPGDP